MTPIRTILHATDFSESAEAAFSLATMLAREHGARVIVLHVCPPPICHGETIARRQDPSYEADLWEMLDQYHAPDPQTPIERLLVEGNPAEQIVRVAHEEGCDLLVLGTHGRTGLSRLMLGSIAEEVLRKASCPVLTVRTPTARPAASTTEEEAAAVPG